jgi:rfaE bifunctional protein nucleotidyltransferase chain/domain
MNQKIKELDKLGELLRTEQSMGRKVVHAHGVFDLLHIGHVRHLQEAKRLGDILVVTVTADRHVNKGPDRPEFPQHLRAEMLAALELVDYVAINRWLVPIETIRILKPDVYVKGPDYRIGGDDISSEILPEANIVKEVGGKIHITEDAAFSSSALLNRNFSPFTEETNEYLHDFRKKYALDEVLEWIHRVSELRPLVVGEAIIDEYLFSSPLGKSSKDPLLAVLYESLTAYAGGALAVANHLAGICAEVSLVSQLGTEDRREEFVMSALLPSVNATFLTKTGTPTICKRRVVDRYSGTKLLEVYMMDDRSPAGDEAEQIVDSVGSALNECDVALVADYGHGMLFNEARELLCDRAPFLAVNAQSNAGNRGLNSISRYTRADYVCLAYHEIENELRRHSVSLEPDLLEVLGRIQCSRITMTMGKDGSMHFEEGKGFARGYALATNIIDRVGAGDAVFALTSLLVTLGAPWDIVAFAGNVAAAHVVAEIGNYRTLNKTEILRHITSLMQ